MFACYLYRIYRNKLVVHRGKAHDQLGINFDFSEKVKVNIDMILFLKNTFESFPEEIGVTSTLPARDHIFKIRDKSEASYPAKEQVASFH